MITLFRTQVLTQGELNWYIEASGVPIDVFEITYEIQDLTGPVAVSVVAETAAARYDVGSYYAPWTVPTDANTGDWQIIWRWKVLSTSDQEVATDPFLIDLPAGSPGSQWYISPEDCYAEGLPRKFTHARVLRRIKTVQQYLERVTGHVFRAWEETRYFDGEGWQIQVLDHPILRLDKLEIDKGFSNFVEEPIRYFTPYTRWIQDRFYPRIAINNDASSSVFSAVNYAQGFPIGTQNIAITGLWGFVDESLQTPEPIKMVMILLVKRWIEELAGNKRKRQGLISQSTDGHSYTLSEALATGRLTGDPEVDSILHYYSKSSEVRVIRRS